MIPNIQNIQTPANQPKSWDEEKNKSPNLPDIKEAAQLSSLHDGQITLSLAILKDCLEEAKKSATSADEYLRTLKQIVENPPKTQEEIDALSISEDFKQLAKQFLPTQLTQYALNNRTGGKNKQDFATLGELQRFILNALLFEIKKLDPDYPRASVPATPFPDNSPLKLLVGMEIENPRGKTVEQRTALVTQIVGLYHLSPQELANFGLEGLKQMSKLVGPIVTHRGGRIETRTEIDDYRSDRKAISLFCSLGHISDVKFKIQDSIEAAKKILAQNTARNNNNNNANPPAPRTVVPNAQAPQSSVASHLRNPDYKYDADDFELALDNIPLQRRGATWQPKVTRTNNQSFHIYRLPAKTDRTISSTQIGLRTDKDFFFIETLDYVFNVGSNIQNRRFAFPIIIPGATPEDAASHWTTFAVECVNINEDAKNRLLGALDDYIRKIEELGVRNPNVQDLLTLGILRDQAVIDAVKNLYGSVTAYWFDSTQGPYLSVATSSSGIPPHPQSTDRRNDIQARLAGCYGNHVQPIRHLTPIVQTDGISCGPIVAAHIDRFLQTGQPRYINNNPNYRATEQERTHYVTDIRREHAERGGNAQRQDQLRRESVERGRNTPRQNQPPVATPVRAMNRPSIAEAKLPSATNPAVVNTANQNLNTVQTPLNAPIPNTQGEPAPDVAANQVPNTQGEPALNVAANQVPNTQGEPAPNVAANQVLNTQGEPAPNVATNQVPNTQEEPAPNVAANQVLNTQEEPQIPNAANPEPDANDQPGNEANSSSQAAENAENHASADNGTVQGAPTRQQLDAYRKIATRFNGTISEKKNEIKIETKPTAESPIAATITILPNKINTTAPTPAFAQAVKAKYGNSVTFIKAPTYKILQELLEVLKKEGVTVQYAKLVTNGQAQKISIQNGTLGPEPKAANASSAPAPDMDMESLMRSLRPQ